MVEWERPTGERERRIREERRGEEKGNERKGVCTSGVCPGDDAVDMLLIAVAVDDDESDRLGLATMDGSRPIVLSKHSTSLMVAGRNMVAESEFDVFFLKKNAVLVDDFSNKNVVLLLSSCSCST